MNRRVVGLLLAVVLAAVATVAIYLYVQRADERAIAGQELRQVYVATQQIEAGTSADAAISQGLIQRRDVQVDSLAQGAIGSLDQIEGLVATVPIVPGQQIVAANFGESAAVAVGTQLEIPEGLQAASFDLDVVPGVAGFISAGDHISVLSLIDLEAGAAPPPTDDATEPAPPVAGEGLQARYMIQNALVLAVGQRVTTFDEGGRPTGKAVQESNENYIFTLALSPEDIEKLVFAETQSTLWATLMPELPEGEEFEPFTTPGANADNLFQ